MSRTLQKNENRRALRKLESLHGLAGARFTAIYEVRLLTTVL